LCPRSEEKFKDLHTGGNRERKGLLQLLEGGDDFRVGFASGQAALFGGELEGLLAVEFGLTDEFIDAVGEGFRGVARTGGLAGKCGTSKSVRSEITLANPGSLTPRF